jgi:hypothetical protein
MAEEAVQHQAALSFGSWVPAVPAHVEDVPSRAFCRLSAVHDRYEAEAQGIVRSRLGMRRGIYDWNRTRDFKTPFRQRNNKAICTAVAACLAAAEATVANDLTDGRSAVTTARHAAVVCAGAAAGALGTAL